jgi:hypothetical protein
MKNQLKTSPIRGLQPPKGLFNLKTPTAVENPVGGFSIGWHNTAVCWNSTFNTACAELIGATRRITQRVWGWYLKCPGWDNDQQKGLLPHPCAVEDMQLYWLCQNVTVTIVNESDGLITKNSAVALPGVGKVIEAPTVNHEELKNHNVMFGIFNNIFAGMPGFRDDRFPLPSFFKVENR